MRIWATIITIVIIYPSHGNATLGGLKKNPDSKNKNDVDDPKKTNNDKDDSNNDKRRRPKKINNKKIRRKKSNNNKKRSNRKQNNTGLNDGSYRWYNIVTVEYLKGNLPEYKNHEDEQNTVLIWGDDDEQNIVLNEYIDAQSMKNLNNNQLIRKKRDYNNTFQHQDKLQTENVKQHDSKENKINKLNTELNTDYNAKDIETQTIKLGNKQNVKKKKNFENHKNSKENNSFEEKLSLIDNLEEDENSMDSDINKNTNESSSINKLKQLVKNKKRPTNTLRNNQTYRHKLRRSSHERLLGKTSLKDNSETETLDQETSKKIPVNLNEEPTISKNLPDSTIEGNIDTAINISELAKIDTSMDEMNSNSDEDSVDLNNDSNSSLIGKKQKIKNYSDIEHHKKRDILKSLEHQLIPNLKNYRKKHSNDKLLKRYEQKLFTPMKANNNMKKNPQQISIKPIATNSNEIPENSNNVPKLTTEFTPKIPAVYEIDKSIDEISSNSDDLYNEPHSSSSSEKNINTPNIINSGVETVTSSNVSTNTNDDQKKKPIERNKSMKKTIANTKLQTSNMNKENIPSIYETQNKNNKGKTVNIPPKDNKKIKISKDSNNIGSMILEENDGKKPKDKTSNVPKIKNKSLKEKKKPNYIPVHNDKLISENTDNTETSNSIDETTEDQIYEYINYHLYENTSEEKLNDKTPTMEAFQNKLPTNPPIKENKIHNKIKPKTVKQKNGRKFSDRNMVNGNNIKTDIPSNPKFHKETSNTIPSNQEILDLFNISDLNSIEEMMESNINDSGSGMPSISMNNIDAIQIENNEESLSKNKDDNSKPLLPNDSPKTNVLDTTKSLEKSNTNIPTPHITVETISNKRDGSKEHSQTPSIGNSAKEVDDHDNSNKYNHIGGIIMEDLDVKQPEYKLPDIPQTQVHDVMKKKKPIPNIINDRSKPETVDLFDTFNFSDKLPDDQSVYIEELTKVKENDEKSNDKSISMIPTMDTYHNPKSVISIGVPFDVNDVKNNDDMFHKKSNPKTVKHYTDNDVDKQIKTDVHYPSIPVNEDYVRYSVPGKQKIVEVIDKTDSSSIEESFESNINYSDSGMSSISMNDIDSIQIENNKESLSKSLEKSNKNIQTPHITVETISNKRDGSKEHSQTPSIGNSAKEVDDHDNSNKYNHIGGIIMEDLDVKQPEYKLPDIPQTQVHDVMKKNKPIPNIINDRSKPETVDLFDTFNFSDKLPDDQSVYIEELTNIKKNDEISNDKSISTITTMDSYPNPKSGVSIGVPFDENDVKNNDDMFHKTSKPKTVKHNTDEDVDKQRNVDVHSIPVLVDDVQYSLPGKQKKVEVFDKSVSNSIEKLLESNINDGGSGMPSISMNDIDAIQIENNEESLRKTKDDETKPLLPNDSSKTIAFDENKSLEKSNTNIQTHHITVETILNNSDGSKEHSKTPSIGNSAKEVDDHDNSNKYNNIGGIKMEDLDVKQPEYKLPDIPQTQVHDVMKKNKPIPNIINDRSKTEIADLFDTFNFSDELPDDQSVYIEGLTNIKKNDEISNDKSISTITTMDSYPNPKSRVSIGVPFDENDVKNNDDMFHKTSKPKTVKHNTDEDVDKQRNVDVHSIPVLVDDVQYSLPGKQKKVEVFDKSVSNSIEKLLESNINDGGSGMPSISMNDIDAIQIENNEESLRKTKDDETKPLLPNDSSKTIAFDENKSLEKSNTNIPTPHITVETISNKRDGSKEHSKTPSIGNSAKEVDDHDNSNKYNNIGGIKMEDLDVKQPEYKLPDIPQTQVHDVMKKNKPIPNIINDRSKTEIADLFDTFNFSDEFPDDQSVYIEGLTNIKKNDEISNDKSISTVTTMDSYPNPKSRVSIGVPFDENDVKNNDDMFHKTSKPKTVKHNTDEDVDKQRNVDVHSIPVLVDDVQYSLPGKQKKVEVFDKSVSNSIEKLLESNINDGGSGMPSISMNDIDAIQIENNEESLRKTKDDETKPLLPNDSSKTIAFDENKSLEKSNTNIPTPHITVETISNKRDGSKEHSKTPSIGNSAKEVDDHDNSNKYNNIGGIKMEDLDVKQPEYKLPDIPQTQVHDVMKKNKPIPNTINDRSKTEIADLFDTFNFSDEFPDDQSVYIEGLTNIKKNDEISNDKSISTITTMDSYPNPKSGVSIGVPFDENDVKNNDDMFHKTSKPKTVKHNTDEDVDKQRNVDVHSIPVLVDDVQYSLPGKQKKVEVFDKSVSNSIEKLLESNINDGGSGMPSISMNDIDAIQIENNEESLRKTKDDETKPLLPNDSSKTIAFDENKSLEKSNTNIPTPHITVETISNKRDGSKEHSKTPSIGNSAKEVDDHDNSNKYNNIGGIKMEDLDVKQPEYKLPDIPQTQVHDVMKKNKPIPNIINDRSKTEIADLFDTFNFSDEFPDDQSVYIEGLTNIKKNDEISNDKSISTITTMDSYPNPKSGVSIGVPFDENDVKNNDDMFHKTSKPKTVKHNTDEDVDKQRNVDVHSIPVLVDDVQYSLPGKQKKVEVFDKSVSNSIEKLLESNINDGGSGMPSISMNDIDAIQIENNEECLRKTKDDETKPLLPNDSSKTIAFDENKSLEKSNTNIPTPHITVETISNKRDGSKEHSKTPSIGNSAKEVDDHDNSNKYNNIGGIKMEDLDVKQPEYKLPDIPQTQVPDVMKKNKPIPNIINDRSKTEIADLFDTFNFSDEFPDDQSVYIEGLTNIKKNDEISNDKSISTITTMDSYPNPKSGVSIGVPFDENDVKNNDDMFHKTSKPKTVKHTTDEDVDKQRNVDVHSIPVLVDDVQYSLPGKQKKVEVFDKSVSNSIEKLLESNINDGGSGMPSISMNDIDAIQIENNEESLRKTKDDETKPLLPNDSSKTIAFDENKSLEKSNTNIQTPHITVETILNNSDGSKEHSKTPSIGNSAKEVDDHDNSNKYNNIGGIKMEDLDVKQPEYKLPDIPQTQVHDVMKKNKPIPNIINDRSKTEIADLFDTFNFSDEFPDDQSVYIEGLTNIKKNDEISNDKSISTITTMDSYPNPKSRVSIGVPFDENDVKNNDDMFHKTSKPKTVKHNTDEDVDKQRNVDVHSIPVLVDDVQYSLPGKQKKVEVFDKSVSNSIEKLLESNINDGGSGMPSISMNDIDAIQIENNEESLRKTKDDETKPLLPNDSSKTIAFDENKSLEKSNTNIPTPHITVETISNKRDGSKEHSKTPSIGNSAKEVDDHDNSNKYNNIGGIKMEDLDVKQPEYKLPDIPQTQVHDVMKKNKPIPNIINDRSKTEIADLFDTFNFSDEFPDDQSVYIEGLTNIKKNDEISNDKSISTITTMDSYPNPKSGVSIGVPFDENDVKNNDDMFHKTSKPKTVKHNTDEDVDKQRNVDVHSIPVLVDDVQYSLPGKQKKVEVFDKSVSNSIEKLLESNINDGGSGMPSISMNDIDAIQIENNEESLRKTKDDETKPLLPNDSSKTIAFDENKSLEKSNTNIPTPHITVETISNKRDGSKEHSKTPSIGNSAKEVDDHDNSNKYNNIGGIKMEDLDVKQPEYKLPDIPQTQVPDVMKKNKPIPNIINDRSKTEIADLFDTFNFSDEFPDDQSVYIEGLTNIKKNDEISNDKSISTITTMDTNPNPKSGDDFLHKNSKPKTEKHYSDDTHSNPQLGLSAYAPFDMKDSILHKIPQPNKNVDGENAKISDSRTAINVEHTLNHENLKDIEKTNMNKDEYLLSHDYPKINVHEGFDNIYYDSNHIDKLTKLINDNHNINHYTSSTMVSSEYNSPLITDYKLTNEKDNPYGYMVPKFSTKYIEGGDSNNNLWETIPSKKNDDFLRNTGFTINNKISSYVNSDKKIATETDTLKNVHDDKGSTDIHSNIVDDSLKILSEQLFKKIENLEDKISKFGKSSNNGPYIGESYNIKSKDPSTKKVIPINDLPNGDPKIKNSSEEPNSKPNSVEINETVINNKSDGENEIKESAKDGGGRYKKNRSHKKREIIDNDNAGRHKKKVHKKSYDIVSEYFDVSQSKNTDKKNKKKVIENIKPQESNDVNNSSSLQVISEDNYSVKGLKIKRKSKKSKKTNSTKRKNASPKNKSKHKKQSKYIKHKNKEITVDVNDEDSISNKNNYNLDETYVETSKKKKMKHKKRENNKHKKPLKTTKSYKYKKIPVDYENKSSDENNVNIEETYNININKNDKVPKQKRLKKMKNFDFNIIKDTENQVLNKNANTKQGYQFFTFYPQYRYTNPLGRLFY
ncbi:hypothetical protein ACI65C_011981 [Semiaphis heraclei]